ncbi:MAG TPA: hypothetical protein VMT23_01055 [Candidatus Binatia bacterium]|nr:hypothetical protein [Candidatus Binatia bacterium]
MAFRQLRTSLNHWRRDTAHWRRVMGRSQALPPGRRLASVSPERLMLWWRHQASLAHRQAQHPPHLAAWLCIQSGIKDGRWSPSLEYLGGGYRVPGHGEGSWTTDGGYDGGLQMNLGFQRSYGAWLLHSEGTANHWNPYEQMWVAERAWKTRGFKPWPATARACGLL